MTDNPQSPIETVEVGPVQQQLRPHRGTLILVLGILGLVCCLICGIIAWILGSTDLKEMDAGRMDPAGRGLTQAGKICGIISVSRYCGSCSWAPAPPQARFRTLLQE